jgi:hypothetical protein
MSRNTANRLTQTEIKFLRARSEKLVQTRHLQFLNLLAMDTQGNTPPMDGIREGLTSLSEAFFVIIMGTLGLSLIPFVTFVIYHFKGIIVTNHSTISSFCADPNHFGNRFLLIVTATVGYNLLSLLAIERSSRDDEDWRFLAQFIAAALFPLVGIFYTGGNGSVEHLNCGAKPFKKIPIKISNWIHMIAALCFVLLFSVTNTWYTHELVVESNSNSALFIILAVLQDASLFIFLATQAIIKFAVRKKKTNQLSTTTRNDHPHAAITAEINEYSNLQSELMRKMIEDKKKSEMNGDERQQRTKSINSTTNAHFTRAKRLFAISFIAEALTFLMVVLLATLLRLQRNSYVPWI